MTSTSGAHSARVALVTCADLPELDEEDAPLVGLLEDRGLAVGVEVWDDPAADWSAYDLVVVRSAWDYSLRRREFLDWARSLPTLRNPANVVAWNSDKHYLADLAKDGQSVVETLWLEPERGYSKRDLHNRFPAREDFVLKPAVSAGSLDTGRYTATNADSRRLAIMHAHRLLEAGRSVMVQRYMPEVDAFGETALVFLHGEFSHAVHKGPMLVGADEPTDGLYKPEVMSPFAASELEIDTAKEILAFARERIPGRSAGSRPLLYARVDLVRREGQRPVLMELELVEPSLFPSLADGALDRIADAIVREIELGPDPRNDASA
ncbi:conserved hypothetical protein [Beutenbergia cavernae DSM 12333]|uniref:ATP-grasp domain-containing protein n=1 Tax=Beutenbergia cavernae (strain ATCC BAA-8 / DSM 12333 / CCUG 43141 / JCM 11478 / NBRC 16432 / NCIMB 13614 / HKI 0122) TaxID=471853 RepID=C5BXM9_BEUC1|nr:hypothetical protein [Beutenbergia cavernae]ACQ80912.1 conserved hypothetical protein [Beutenbergia cavernae DSM 12333]